MIIAEDLVLLSYDDELGVWHGGPADLDARLVGALLVDLALAGRIDVVPEPADGQADGQKAAGRQQPADGPQPGAVLVRDATPTGQPLLDSVLAAVTPAQNSAQKPAQKPVQKLAKDLVNDLSTGLTRQVLEHLADRGVLRRDKGKVLGIFPVTRWPADDSAHEEALRRTLIAVLVDGQEPDARTRALVALMGGTGMIRHVVGKEHRKAAEARAQQLADGDWASGAVERATDEIAALVMASVIMPSVVITASS